MPELTLLRHGESVWNREDRFAGWADVDLTRDGVAEARRAGRLLRREGLVFDVAFSSVLRRAVRSLWIVLEETGRSWLPVHKSWRLNERHYGALEGVRRAETVRRWGEAQTWQWRWSYHASPPAVEPDDPRFPGREARYAGLRREEIPCSESLKDTLDRLLPLWEGEIAPRLRAGQRVLVVAHGSSLRALIKHLDGIADADVPDLRIPTGQPIVYRLDAALAPVERRTLAARPLGARRWLKRQWARRVARHLPRSRGAPWKDA